MRRNILNYVGSKANLADWIIGVMPEHRVYVEVFGGSAAVLMAKGRSKVEVVNDIDGDLVNFWRVVRDRGEELRRFLLCTPYARKEYEELVRRGVRAEDPVRRAAEYYVLMRQSFSGKFGAGWSRSTEKNHAYTWLETIDQELPRVAARLAGVVIENLPWQELIPLYDTEETCFYLDPPYLNVRSDKLYRNLMSEDEHRQMCEMLRTIKGAAVVSGYHNPIYDDLLGDWTVLDRTVPLHSQRSDDERTKATETLWINRQVGLWT